LSRALGADERRGRFITKPSVILRGERPRWPRDAVRGDKRTGEASRVLPGRHKSAEPVEVGRLGTSAPEGGPTRMPAKERATEPMAEASPKCEARQRGSGRVGRKAGGALVPCGIRGTEGVRNCVRQPSGEPAGLEGPNPRGVESAPVAGERSLTEPKNLVLASPRSTKLSAKMTEATGDRDDEGRSLRSSPRAGKPSTWRREAVDTACKQGVDWCPAR
jgi:hypothetical protein